MSFERDAFFGDPLPDSPLPIIDTWLRDAKDSSSMRNPDAMALATQSSAGAPCVRMVLCRGFDPDRGHLLFYTNRQSDKGHDLDTHPVASAVFYWDDLGRQLRVNGAVMRSPDDESDRYFASRARLSRIAARVSEQSRPIASREHFVAELDAELDRFGGIDGEAPIPRPAHWGGYHLVATRVECWTESRHRAHDRVLWQRGAEGAVWQACRLAP